MAYPAIAPKAFQTPLRTRLLSADNLIIALFAGLALLGTLRHEMWMDELQAWMIARESSSLGELLSNLRYEGHPIGWYLVLYGLNWITPNPIVMQIAHWLITVAGVAVLTKLSPFSWRQKLLLSFGYFTFFEYGVISRGYSLCQLVIFLFCALYCLPLRISPGQKPEQSGKVTGWLMRHRVGVLAGLLAVAANLSAYGLLLSGALALLLVAEWFEDWRAASERPAAIRAMNRRSAVGAVALLVAGWLVSALQIIRPVHNNEYVRSVGDFSIETAQTPSLAENIRYLAAVISNIWKSYGPMPMPQIDFWESNLLSSNDSLPEVAGQTLGDLGALLLSVGLLAIALFYFSKKPLVAWVYGLGNAFILTFNFLFWMGVIRHHGHLFVLLVACFWIFLARGGAGEASTSRRQWGLSASFFLTLILSLQMIGGVYAFSIEVLYPFSQSRATAAYIQENGLDQLPILGEDRDTSVLAGYLNRPFYYLNRQEIGTFWQMEVPYGVPEPERIEQLRQGLTQVEGDRVLVILKSPLALRSLAGVALEPLAHFNTPMIYRPEVFYLYLAQRSAPDGGSA
ncbi:MAG TPA: hypothetical protein V6D06_16065 [Trichocoleus sp.]